MVRNGGWRRSGGIGAEDVATRDGGQRQIPDRGSNPFYAQSTEMADDGCLGAGLERGQVRAMWPVIPQRRQMAFRHAGLEGGEAGGGAADEKGDGEGNGGAFTLRGLHGDEVTRVAEGHTRAMWPTSRQWRQIALLQSG